jgi:hypothetical protein
MKDKRVAERLPTKDNTQPVVLNFKENKSVQIPGSECQIHHW